MNTNRKIIASPFHLDLFHRHKMESSLLLAGNFSKKLGGENV